MKDKGEEGCDGLKGIKSGVRDRMCDREGVAVVVKDELHEGVKEGRKINSWIIWMKI